MTVSEISYANIWKYADQIDCDDAENIERPFYHGIVLENDEGLFEAGAIWEVHSLENEHNDTIAEISWLDVTSEEAGDYFITAYTSSIQDEEITDSHFELVDERGKDSGALLTSYGFTTKERECRTIIVTVADLKNIASLKLDKRVPEYIHPLSDISDFDFNRGVVNCIFHSHRPLVQDLISLPLAWYEPDISCYVETDGRADGFLLVHRTPSGKLRIELFINNGPDPKTELYHMARFAVKKTIEKYDDDTQIILIRRDIPSVKFAARLFPGIKGETALVGRRREKT